LGTNIYPNLLAYLGAAQESDRVVGEGIMGLNLFYIIIVYAGETIHKLFVKPIVKLVKLLSGKNNNLEEEKTK